MSLDTISIARQFPIINGFVQLPNNNPTDKTSVPVAAFSVATGGVVRDLPHTGGMGRQGRRFGPQQWVEFIEPYYCCSADLVIEAGKTLYQTNYRTDQMIPWNQKR